VVPRLAWQLPLWVLQAQRQPEPPQLAAPQRGVWRLLQAVRRQVQVLLQELARQHLPLQRTKQW
jgi:hypothetical protein